MKSALTPLTTRLISCEDTYQHAAAFCSLAATDLQDRLRISKTLLTRTLTTRSCVEESVSFAHYKMIQKQWRVSDAVSNLHNNTEMVLLYLHPVKGSSAKHYVRGYQSSCQMRSPIIICGHNCPCFLRQRHHTDGSGDDSAQPNNPEAERSTRGRGERKCAFTVGLHERGNRDLYSAIESFVDNECFVFFLGILATPPCQWHLTFVLYYDRWNS